MRLKSLLWLFVLSFSLSNLFASSDDCSFIPDLKEKNGLKCGYLEVPENHGRPEGKKITIAYAIVRSVAEKTSPDAMIFLSGGPGSRSIDANFIGVLKNSEISKKRDIVIFDQRGIGLSSPLPDIGKDVFNAMAADTDVNGERRLVAKTLREYRKKASLAGIELGNYNTFQSARDVGSLMEALGYKKFNLFGISYGTRLARTIQGLYPEKINAVILDSPNKMSDDFLIHRMQSYSAAAEKVFKACIKNKDCERRFPDLREDYVKAVRSLKKNPMPVKDEDSVFYLNPQDAVYFLRRQLYRNDALNRFPEFVDALKFRKEDMIRDAVSAEKTDVSNGGFNSSMFLAVSVYESMDDGNTNRVIDGWYKKLPHFPAQLGFFTSLYLEGMNWHGKRLPVERRTFKRSAVPTIIFVNQYDPVTPPENGKLFQKQLDSSHLFVIDEAGHSGGDFDCKMRVMVQFMDSPKTVPDASCLKLFKPEKGRINQPS